MIKKRNPFAKKSQGSFLNLVSMITESDDFDETEGLDFDDETEGDDFADDDFADDELGDDEFDSEDDGDTVTLSIPRSLAMELMDALQSVIDGEEGDDEFSDDEFDDETDDEFADDEFAPEDEEDEMEEEAEEDEMEENVDEAEEDEEVLGSDQSMVAQSTISRKGAPTRSKASTTWNTGKTVKSIYDTTASGEGDAVTVSDGAPKRSKFTTQPDRSGTVRKTRIQPGKHMFQIGKGN